MGFQPFLTRPRRLLVGLGDSHTYNNSYGLAARQFYPALVGVKCAVPSINRGVSGDSTAQCYARRRQTVQCGIPDIALVYCGTNDLNAAPVVAASPVPTSTVFSIDTGESYYVADGWITVAGESAQIASMSSKQITLTAALVGGAPSAGAAVRLDTQKNLEKIVAYWRSLGIPRSRIYIVGQHYLNFSASGDTVGTPQTLANTTRTAQSAAATAAGVNYIDTYAYMSALIGNGYTQGDFAWHVADQNSHLNATGEAILASAIKAAIRR